MEINSPREFANRESIHVDELSGSLKDSAILVVDDSRLMRIVLTKALQELGFTNISEAVDGRDAIKKLSEGSYELMLLDMEMPEMNGIEVLIAKYTVPKLKEVTEIEIEPSIEAIQDWR